MGVNGARFGAPSECGAACCLEVCAASSLLTLKCNPARGGFSHADNDCETTVGPVLTAVRTLVAINVNVQPDKNWPGTKPADVTAAAGEYKVSAIRVGLVDSAGLLSLQLGSSSAGPVALAVP